MSRNNDYTRGKLLDYLYHQKYYKLIILQTNTSITQQTNLTGKLEEEDGATMFFIAENQQKINPKEQIILIMILRIMIILNLSSI